MKLFLRSMVLLSILATYPWTFAFANADDAEADMEKLGSMLAGCAFESPPELADFTILTDKQIGDLGASVRSYVGSIQLSLNCLDAVEEKLGDAISDKQRVVINSMYNNGVDQMSFIAGQYNKQINAYKMGQRVPDLSNPSDLGSHH